MYPERQNNLSKPNKLDPALLPLVPDHPAAKRALDIALRTLSPAILNHSFRIYIYAKAYSILLQQAESAPTDPEPVFVELHTLFVACMFHDLTIGPEYDDDKARFEVAGAKQATKLLREFHVSEVSIREAWLAMALHTSPGIGEHLGGTTGAFRSATRADFDAITCPELQNTEVELIERLPRLKIEKVLCHGVLGQAF